MKKLLSFITICIFILGFVSSSGAATKMYGRVKLTGVGTDSVDGIAYADLNEGYLCLVITSAKIFSLYRWDSTETAAEDLPWFIEANDDGGGDGRWELVELNMIIKEVPWSIVDSDTAVTTGDGVVALTIPASMNGMNLVDVVCSVHTKGITGATDIQIRRRRAGANVDVLSTKITIGDEFYASDEVINASNDDVNTGDQYYIDVDAIHSGTAPNGLSCVLDFQLP